MTLPAWTNTITVDGTVWYLYSEGKMVEDFPLLFSIPKRVYKNMKELADSGFIELSSFGKKKYMRFTNKCRTWNRREPDCNKSENGPHNDVEEQWSENGPHNDVEEQWSENGPKSGPKTDQKRSENGPHNYIINNYNINNKKEPEKNFSGLFPEKENQKKLRGTTEANRCLFANSRFSKFEDFEKCFDKPEFDKIDILYYYHSVADWSASKGRMQKDWIAQTRNFIRIDREKGKLHLKPEPSKFDYEGAMEYLKGDYNDL